MAIKRVLIDLNTRDKKQRAKARTIATDKATGLTFAGFNEEHGDFLVVIAAEVDKTKAVEKIRKAGLAGAKLISVKQQN
ncbi:hypothetical protein ACJRO7_022154 [Eucalyptus globulus]|uniref:Uncharacterized protein n=1 Tax=Eucalyptus globulus TaxID=34317 RepID=A0ABD3KMB0_EUCGL